MQTTLAGAVILKAEYQSLCPVNSIVVTDPLVAVHKFISQFPYKQSLDTAIHPSAVIHPSVQLGTEVNIGPFVTIEANVRVGDRVVIGANSVIQAGVTIGQDTHLGAGVLVDAACIIGQKVSISSGCILGAMPYNYQKKQGTWQLGPTYGGVVLEDEVQLGANTVIDRGTVGDTYIARGVCIDNLVHIAHDVIIGSHTAIAGSATLGSHVAIGADCIIGGASCIAAFVQLVDDVVITGMSTVNKSITRPGIYSSGTLAHEHQHWRKNAARFRRLDDYIMRLKLLERKINSNE